MNRNFFISLTVALLTSMAFVACGGDEPDGLGDGQGQEQGSDSTQGDNGSNNGDDDHSGSTPSIAYSKAAPSIIVTKNNEVKVISQYKTSFRDRVYSFSYDKRGAITHVNQIEPLNYCDIGYNFVDGIVIDFDPPGSTMDNTMSYPVQLNADGFISQITTTDIYDNKVGLNHSYVDGHLTSITYSFLNNNVHGDIEGPTKSNVYYTWEGNLLKSARVEEPIVHGYSEKTSYTSQIIKYYTIEYATNLPALGQWTQGMMEILPFDHTLFPLNSVLGNPPAMLVKSIIYQEKFIKNYTRPNVKTEESFTYRFFDFLYETNLDGTVEKETVLKYVAREDGKPQNPSKWTETRYQYKYTSL